MEPLVHRVAEQRSLALHREVAGRLGAHPELLDRARARVADWRQRGCVDPGWVEAWSDLLALPLADIIAGLTDPGQHSCDLRQCSPFAGALEPRERWQVLRDADSPRGLA